MSCNLLLVSLFIVNGSTVFVDGLLARRGVGIQHYGRILIERNGGIDSRLHATRYNAPVVEIRDVKVGIVYIQLPMTLH